MKKRKSGYQKEKMIMIVSSVLVLAAMTVTGVYIYRNNRVQEPGENVVDFSALENHSEDGQVAQAENSTARNLTSGRQTEGELDYDPYYIEQERLLNEQAQEESAAASERNADASAAQGAAELSPEAPTEVPSDPADALEAGETAGGMSNNVGYAMVKRSGTPGLGMSDGQASEAADVDGADTDGGQALDELDMDDGQALDELTEEPGGDGITAEETGDEAGSGTQTENAGDGMGEETDQIAAADENGIVSDVVDAAAGDAAAEAVADVLQEALNLHFSESDALAWPIAGNILLNYSMDKTIYFPTLQQYKYNPSIVIASTQGTNVACAANSIVKEVYEDAQTGNTVVTSLGDGYELTYGQLTNVTVEEGDFVEEGVVLGQVAAPTKYYSMEGTNVYIKLTKDGEPVNPLDYLG